MFRARMTEYLYLCSYLLGVKLIRLTSGTAFRGSPITEFRGTECRMQQLGIRAEPNFTGYQMCGFSHDPYL